MPYLDQTDFSPSLTAALDVAEVEYAEASAELPRAMAALEQAKETAFKAQARFNNFMVRINRASRRSQDELLGVLSGALADEELDERRLRDAANIALTRAQKGLANFQWRHANLATDIQQLRKALGPLPMEAPPLQAVPRPARPEVDADEIVMPAPRGAA
jgi:multidrug resistance efflux pump